MMHRGLICLLLMAAPGLSVHSESGTSAAVLLGYSAQGAARESEWERTFQAGISADNIRENMRRLTARPHHVGSAYDKDNAEWILARFSEWGYDAHIETFDVLFPTPKTRALEMLQPTAFKATLQEPAIPVDPTSSQTSEQLPTYNAYSADGDVTAPLVYVNYGNREDYEELDRLGMSVKGAIVIARYGGGWRGVKPKVAAEHGAVGCIIYSDPKADGYYQGDEYPAGRLASEGRRTARQRHGHGLSRRSLDPGRRSDRRRRSGCRSRRRKPSPAFLFCRFPIRGCAAVARRTGRTRWRRQNGAGRSPSPTTSVPAPRGCICKSARTGTSSRSTTSSRHCTVERRAGQWVIRGNHHDAWVNGADDPIAGQAAMLEEARVMGEMHARGWTPERTIIYCAWDGEEPGLLGSVEWVETHLDELQKHAVAYINSDTNERGYMLPGGTQDLENFISGVARGITDPETQMSVYQRSHLYSIAKAKSAEERSEARKRNDLEVTALGDGSDFTAFQDYAGISTLSVEFGEEDDGTQYHSIYDDFYWYTHFVDTDFAYGRALSQTAGTAIMRLADADLIPVDYSPQAEAIANYEAELEKLLKDKQEEYKERNLELEEGMFKAMLDPHRPTLPPPAESVPPFMNFAPMKNAIALLKRSAERYSQALATYQGKGSPPLAQQSLALINADLLRVSRLFLNQRGLPERPWFKNQIYAPGAYTGYGAKPIAAVREYMDEKRWREAEGQVPQVAQVIENAAAGINKAADDLERELAKVR